MNYYVLKYGPAYVSEIYHYFETSKILETYQNQTINVLSLGCGFAPDFFAISQYIKDKGLNVYFQYYGIDQSNYWNTTRLTGNGMTYWQHDLTNPLLPFSFQNYHIIFMNKVFSTIYKHNLHSYFLKNLINAINTTMAKNAVIVLGDINDQDMGRDEFDRTISGHFSSVKRFYTAVSTYFERNWILIPQTNIIYPLNNYGSISPLPGPTKTVFFEYRK
jgi:hypothetical protein